MTAGGYVLALVSIISGLAISDVVISLNRLIRAHRRVQWDWLPLVAAAVAVGAIVVSWWFSWLIVIDPAYTPTFGRFLTALCQLVVLYLLACAALPDEIPDAGIDLRAYYEENGRYFWGLYAGLTAFFLIKDVIIVGAESSAGQGPLGVIWAGAAFVAAALLSAFRRRAIHMALVPLLLAASILPNLAWSL